MRAGLIALALLLALSGAGWYGYAQHTRAVAAEGKVTTLTADLSASRALTKRIQAAVAKVESQRDEAQAGLKKALATDPEWAGGRVPTAVSDELCKRLKCTGVQPVPTP